MTLPSCAALDWRRASDLRFSLPSPSVEGFTCTRQPFLAPLLQSSTLASLPLIRRPSDRERESKTAYTLMKPRFRGKVPERLSQLMQRRQQEPQRQEDKKGRKGSERKEGKVWQQRSAFSGKRAVEADPLFPSLHSLCSGSSDPLISCLTATRASSLARRQAKAGQRESADEVGNKTSAQVGKRSEANERLSCPASYSFPPAPALERRSSTESTPSAAHLQPHTRVSLSLLLFLSRKAKGKRDPEERFVVVSSRSREQEVTRLLQQRVRGVRVPLECKRGSNSFHS